jgi:beta-lactamase regulating signal transducer with metallopeptidase domain
MNRTFLTVSEEFSALGPLLVESAVKGTALLVLAAIAATILRRDSAATRHLVWLLAMVAMMVVPVLSAMLPQWRVLPEWAGILRHPVIVDSRPASLAGPAQRAGESPQIVSPVEVERPVYQPPASHQPAGTHRPTGELTDSRPAWPAPQITPLPGWNWTNALPLVWAIGFSVLVVRLLAARWMLYRLQSETRPPSRATIMGSKATGAKATPDAIVTALEAVCRQLAIVRPVTVLIHPDKTIPIVWGILRCHLLLPGAARHWSGEQLRSVLLHELAHVKRRDTMAQLLTQIACALYWFNPLVWFAAWRLGVERERACDDLVLASGVRPSAYAGHLLEVVTQLSPARLTQSCGLAMARKSSLEGRLTAVLSGKRNRRGVTRMLVAAAVVVAVAVAIPLAILRAVEPDQPKTETADMKAEAKRGAKLQPGTQEKLEWGAAVNGLRMALAWPPTLGEPAAGDVPDFFLAVQNVSAAPVRLCTTAEAPHQRRLTFSTNGVPQGRTVSSEPNGVDVTLEPREVVFLRLFVESAKDDTPRASHGSMLAATVRQSPAMTLLADIEIAKAPEGAWTGKLVTPETRAGVGAQAPKNRKAQELFKVWLANARVNGKIPGGCIARLGDKVSQFVLANAGDKSGEPYAKKMEPLVPRLDGARDWQPAEASALLMDIAAVSDVPLSVMLEEIAGMTILYSPSLTKELESAPWGKALPNGLRVACLLEPRAAAHRLGTALTMRILIHNAGQETVVFRARTWHHIEPTARNAKGAEIEMESITRYTRPPLVAFRLVPGGFFELASPGVGIGKYGFHDFKNADVASWMDAKVGDEVTLTPGPVPLGDWNEVSVDNSQPRWWLDFLTARLNLATPLPADAAERAELLRRTVSDVFYSDVTAEEIAAFVGDREGDALESLAKRLAGRSNLKPFSGSLESGTTKFRVTAEDPRAAKPPEKRPAQAAPAGKSK